MSEEGGTTAPPAIDRKVRLKVPAQHVPKQPPEVRVHNWEETYQGFDLETARIEAYRCIQCPAAPCQKACPVHNDIPGAFNLLEQGDAVGAANVFRQTSNLPEVCGRICPQEKLCEGDCVVGKHNIPVQIGKLEAFCSDYQRRTEGLPVPVVAERTGRRVAVVGAGPAGLAVAELTAAQGHDVTVFDAWPYPGGLLTYGIPNFKLSKRIVREKMAQLEALDIRFVTNTVVGRDVRVRQLLDDQGFDVVFVGVGATKGGRMRIPGEDLPKVHQATDFLVRANAPQDLLPPGYHERPWVGDRCIVIGGGDTAMDCVRSARRLGAGQVACVYRRTEAEMRCREEERRHAVEEGVQFRYLVQPLEFLADASGKLVGVRCQEMRLTEADESGRRRPEPIPGHVFDLACDSAVVAVGYSPDDEWQRDSDQIETDRSGLVVIDRRTGRTSDPRVFAGGDIVNGADLVVTAMADGRRAAAAINEYLSQLGCKGARPGS